MNKHEARRQQWEFVLALLKERGIEPLDEAMTLSGNGYNIIIHSKDLVNCLCIGPKMTNEEIINYIDREVETTKHHLEKRKQFKKIFPDVREGSPEWAELYNKFGILFDKDAKEAAVEHNAQDILCSDVNGLIGNANDRAAKVNSTLEAVKHEEFGK